MSSIYDFPKVTSPYPENTPWYDLSSLIVNDWEADNGAFVFYAKLEANDVHIYLRTRRGTNNVVILGMPVEIRPKYQTVMNPYLAINEAGYAFLVNTGGSAQIWVSGNDYSRVANGSLLNLVVESTYARRAP